MNASQFTFPAAAKAYIALIGSIAAALLAVFTADTSVGMVLTVIVIVATAVTTWAVPNSPDGGGL